jgi:hypothetical protein
VADISGKQVAVIMNERQNGLVTRPLSVAKLPDGNYYIRLKAGDKTVIRKITITH